LHCGSPLPQPKICPKCQRVNVSEAKFCGYCGAEFDLR
jgi:predicted amidophosphoribosyltransferase